MFGAVFLFAVAVDVTYEVSWLKPFFAAPIIDSPYLHFYNVWPGHSDLGVLGVSALGLGTASYYMYCRSFVLTLRRFTAPLAFVLMVGVLVFIQFAMGDAASALLLGISYNGVYLLNNTFGFVLSGWLGYGAIIDFLVLARTDLSQSFKGK